MICHCSFNIYNKSNHCFCRNARIPEPRGRKSLPTMLSSTEDLPELCLKRDETIRSQTSTRSRHAGSHNHKSTHGSVTEVLKKITDRKINPLVLLETSFYAQYVFFKRRDVYTSLTDNIKFCNLKVRRLYSCVPGLLQRRPKVMIPKEWEERYHLHNLLKPCMPFVFYSQVLLGSPFRYFHLKHLIVAP